MGISFGRVGYSEDWCNPPVVSVDPRAFHLRAFSEGRIELDIPGYPLDMHDVRLTFAIA